MASLPTFTSYAQAVAATTTVAYSIGAADALYITATCSSGLTLTMPGGGTVAVGNAVIGTIIPIASVSAAFAAGGVVAMKVQ
jgi:hypothetical protein